MNKKFFFFVFKHRHRVNIFNNLLRVKKVNGYKIFNISGPLRYYFFSIFVIFFVERFNNFFKNFCLISCDSRPIIKKNGINIWFGGTSHKIPEIYNNLKNNCHVFENFVHKEKNLIKFYPTSLDYSKPNKKIKIVFVGDFRFSNHTIVNKIWKKEKNRIFNDYSIIDKKSFWNKYNLKKDLKTLVYYIGLRDLVRFHTIYKLHKEFKNEMLVVGTRWKPYIKSSLNSNYNFRYVKSLYKGNICLDFGSKWGSNCLYPRAVNIVESGGVLLQSKQSDTKKIFGKINKDISFNNYSELVKKINKLKKNEKTLNDLYSNQYKLFNNKNLNYQTLKKIFLISKKK